MRIKDFSWSHSIGIMPEVELYLSDVTSEELTALRDFALGRDRIKIESKEGPKPSPVRPITTDGNPITINDTITAYIRSDAEMTARMYGISKIELTPRVKVEKVIFSKPATIVFWSDGTKTVVKCGENDRYDPEKGFFIACTKKLFGNDYKAVGRMNKALEMAVVQTKEEK